MCTNPIKILNPSKWIASDKGQQLFLRVPCGHCVECRNRIQNEWRVRSYYECMEIIQDGGYMLFDTLTYKNKYLPRVSDFIDVPKDLDFSCFRSEDVQAFMHRLRTYLSRPLKDKKTKRLIRPGYDVDENLRYFLVSEYGSENRTCRPHYHVFFLVKKSVIPVESLSYAISHCWYLGRTDGMPYRSHSYVVNHNTFKNLDECTKRCVLYVSKYVAKDFQYTDKVRKRLFKLMCYHYPDFDWQMSKQQRGFYQMLVRFVSPFHRQSLNFGNYYVKVLGLNNIIQNGYLKFNFKGIPQIYSVFPSLKRKFFYNRTKIDGDIHFYLNDLGIQFKMNRLVKSVKELDLSIEQYNLNNDEKINVDSFDMLFNQDRLLSKSIQTLSEAKEYLIESLSVTPYNSLRNYSSLDRSFIHKSVFTKRDFGSKKRGFSTCNVLKPVHVCECMDYDNYITLDDLKKYAYHSEANEKLYELFLQWRKNKGEKDLAVARHKERIKKLYKNIGLL